MSTDRAPARRMTTLAWHLCPRRTMSPFKCIGLAQQHGVREIRVRGTHRYLPEMLQACKLLEMRTSVHAEYVRKDWAMWHPFIIVFVEHTPLSAPDFQMDAQGRLFHNSAGVYLKSDSILQVGFRLAEQQISSIKSGQQ